ncbi:bifunctional riboflavin kinase/FAD synthetase [Veillonella sp.]|uniref:bifunctional riboflavin kinase/FAD synthetase n=1 Tax=Veillonella sp. TaxID=1926307 RepID=UPI0025FCE722|nr:bifunctional riboflavin kinase/FAD synthetase [Veillonella sp.]
MKHLHSFDELRQINRKIVYALGTFDGVHRGHQRVIGNAIAEAKAHDAVTVLVTFSAHPMTILRPGDVPKRVLSADIMDEILESLKVDYILRLPMNLDIFNMSPDEFLDALCGDIDVVGIAIGTNFTFGAKGAGNPQLMRERLSAKGIHIIVEPLLSTEEGPICSTNIRKAIEEGHMEQATAWLGRPYQFRGIVIKGDQRGRTLGFPTINFLLPNEMAIPPDGVYANRVCIDGIWYDGVGNIGDNPTFKNQYHRCEVHVFDFDQDVYGKEVTVQFISYIRSEVKFNNLQELIDQMKVDEETAIRILRNNP